MPYTTPSAAEFKVRHPAFASVADAIVNAVLAEGAARVSPSWMVADYQPAIMLFAAHALTLEGQGATTEGQLVGFTSLGIGSLRLSTANTGSGKAGGLRSTTYGQRYLELAHRNSPGALVV